MTTPFAITRKDGRSNAQVILDLVKHGEPGRLYTYEELGTALNHEGKTYQVNEICAAVRLAGPRLLREQQRALHCIRTQGYRLAPAADHKMLALSRTRRADMQMHHGWDVLRNVRWDELSTEERKAHEGTLIVVGSVCQALHAVDQRLRKVETAIAQAKGVVS